MLDKYVHSTLVSLLNTKGMTNVMIMRTFFYIAPTCFGLIRYLKKFLCQYAESGAIIMPKHVGAV